MHANEEFQSFTGGVCVSHSRLNNVLISSRP